MHHKKGKPFIILEGTVYNVGEIHDRDQRKTEKYMDWRSSLERMNPGHKIMQLNVVFDFLSGYHELDLKTNRCWTWRRMKYCEKVSEMLHFTKLRLWRDCTIDKLNASLRYMENCIDYVCNFLNCKRISWTWNKHNAVVIMPFPEFHASSNMGKTNTRRSRVTECFSVARLLMSTKVVIKREGPTKFYN